ncbi:MAG: hypothetical protein AAFN94_15045 [Pseudomonadota bacterium]
MQVSRLHGLLAILLTLAACGDVTSSSDRFKGSAVVGGYQVGWNKVLKTNDPASRTPLFFSFTPTDTGASGVTEANWQREAQRQNVPVEVVKRMFNPPYIYPSSTGGVASCTAFVIRQGGCRHIKTPSDAEKVSLARAALQTSATCRWIGYDRGFDTMMRARAGAIATTLWARADCSSPPLPRDTS